MEKIKCSIPILTLNAEKYLDRCLASIIDFADVFLLDGNSTDRTLEIAKKYNIWVYKQVDTAEKNIAIKDFSAMRIKSVNLCKYDWVLWVDSDEFLPKELSDEIREKLADIHDKNIIFNIPKKYIIKDKKIEYAFNYPNYYPRLHHRQSGAKFIEGKLVHEQMFIPPDVKIINLTNRVYSQLPDSYGDCIKKDKFQLNLMRQSTFAKRISRTHSIKMSILYFLRAIKILLKSLLIYFKHGYRRSLPFGHVVRHVRTHLFVSYWRLKLLYYK